jgi:hypothetical protein
MQNIEYGKFFGQYIGVIAAILELLLATISISALVLLEINKEKIDKVLLYIFKIILWFSLLFSLVYIIWGIVGGILYRLGVCYK